MFPYACDRDEGNLRYPNWRLVDAESRGSLRGTRATDRSDWLQLISVGNECTRCASTPERWKETPLSIGQAQSQRSGLKTSRRSANGEQVS